MLIPRARRAQSAPSKKTIRKTTCRERGRTGRAAAQAVESMESRRMMSVSLDAAGWTKITPSSDSKTVYVSSSEGDDKNSGLSADAPVKTLSKGASLLRSGSPDWLVLKRGDVFYDTLPNWTKSGRNDQEPMVLGAYGDTNADRPWLKTGAKRGFYTDKPIHDVAIVGLKFSAHTRNPDSSEFTGTAGDYGVRTVGAINNLLIEDSSFDHYKYNMSFSGFNGTAKNIKVRRSQITDAYDTSKSVGIYASQTDGLLIEGNLIDHNGWNEKISAAAATMYSHNIYLWASSVNPVIRDNIISNAASHGVQARGGGTIEGNVFLRNPVGALLGNGSEVKAGGVTGSITGNVFLEDRDINGAVRGWAIEAGNIKAGSGATISDNIITQDSQNRFAAIRLLAATDASNASTGVGINDLEVTRNIVYKWFSGLTIANDFKLGGSGMTGLNDLEITDNDFQSTGSSKIISQPQAFNGSEETFEDNRYYNSSSSNGWFSVGGSTTAFANWQAKYESSAVNQQVQYPDPTRTVKSYHASLGGTATESAFIAAIESNDRTGFDASLDANSVIAYIRAGFTGVTPSEEPTEQPEVVTPPPAVQPPTTEQPPVVVNTTPTASLAAVDDKTSASTAAQQIKVTYADDKGIAVSSFGNGDIKVTGPSGATQAVTFVSADSKTDGPVRTATYAIAAPGGSWDSSDNGTYKINLNNTYGVKDVDGNYADAQHLGSMTVNIAPPVAARSAAVAALATESVEAAPVATASSAPAAVTDDAPPQVLWSMFDPDGQTITMQFSKDVSASIRTSSLRLKDLQTKELVPYDHMRMTYDAATNTATWWFTEKLPIADYQAVVVAPGITDAAGNHLDGNADGQHTVFDDYSLVINASDMEASAQIASGIDIMAPSDAVV